ncbi:hypothetical protein, partial [Salmonella enterica]|uniref:hypothetical protein n=1 Tax=Salmonella enterica TaxID=28901 RepID=UPI003CE8B1C9
NQFYNYAGTTEIFPEYDGAYDTTYAPDVNVTVDMTSAFVDFTKALNEIVPLKVTDTSKTSKSSSKSDVTVSGNTTTTKTT